MISEEFDEDGVAEMFKWAEAKKAVELQNDFHAQVKITKSLSLKAKQLAKHRKIQRAVKLVKLPIEQLKQSIQNVLKPEDSEEKLSVETLLGKLFV